MRGIKNVYSYFRYFSASKLLVAGLAIVSLALLTVTLNSVRPVGAMTAERDNSSNAIMKGGALTPREFMQKYTANAEGDLAAIYTNYGMTKADASNFGEVAVMGVSTKSGDVIVDGKVVAKNAVSIGREKKAGSKTVTVAGKKYYQDTNQDVYHSDSLPTMVVMKNGVYSYAIIAACGNPIEATPVVTPPAPKPVAPQKEPEQPKPTASCKELKGELLSREERRYRFTATSNNLNNGAVLKSTDFDFGDGNSQKAVAPTDGLNVSAEHAYGESGSYTITATLHYEANGQTMPESSCSTSITIAQAATASVESLPSTGPTETAVATLGLSSLTAAGLMLRKSRRQLLSGYIKR